MPPDYLDTLDNALEIRQAQKPHKRVAVPIWSLSRVRIWQIGKEIMIAAGTPDAPRLRDQRYGNREILLHMLQKWIGHAQPSTAAIYAKAVGKEEQDIAVRMGG